jgi:putative glutamine amidotransferase
VDSESAPLVAVTGPDEGASAPRRLVALALRWAGARPVQLSPSQPSSQERYQAVVITGGHDIDPVLYAEVSQVKPLHDRARDAFESHVIDDAVARDLPLLGICRGAQLLNVRLGGNLHQALKEQRQRTSNRRTVLPLKQLCITHGSYLARLFHAERTRINSLHNQGIDRLGHGLAVAGRDLDNIVQAIEMPAARFIVGVQWHPEFLLFMPRQLRLFSALVQAIDGQRRTLPLPEQAG